MITNSNAISFARHNAILLDSSNTVIIPSINAVLLLVVMQQFLLSSTDHFHIMKTIQDNSFGFEMASIYIILLMLITC